jgi:site-specific recombinase XerD
MKKNKSENSAFFWSTAADFLNRYLPNIRRASDCTVESYRNCLNRFVNYLEEEKGAMRKTICFKMLNRENIMDYMAWMHTIAKLAPKTCNLRLTALHSLLEYASQESVDITPVCIEAGTIRGVRVARGPIAFFERDVVSALMTAPDTSRKPERRNQMLLVFLYDTAARVSEALHVRLCDIHMKASIPHVTFYGKGRKYRSVPLMDSTTTHLERYLREFHRDESRNSGVPLFYTVTHGTVHNLSVDTPEKMLKKYAKTLRTTCLAIPENVHCHMIRKTRAMHLYQEGVPLPHIQQLLGHEVLSTTSGFYAFATLETLAKSLEKANPSQEDKLWKDKESSDKLFRL